MCDVSIRHHVGRFSLEAEFSIESRWTILYGPSGAGKSTILRIVAGLIRPEQGHVRLHGKTLFDSSREIFLAPGARSIGFVTQQPGLFPHLSVGENVAFGIRHLDGGARAARVTEMLRFFGAEALTDRKTPQLSGGERQRVALARALAPAPQLLLLDEPLTALDDASARDILSRLLAIETQVLYVSHDLAEIWPIPGQVLILENGRISARGALREVLTPQRNRLLDELQG